MIEPSRLSRHPLLLGAPGLGLGVAAIISLSSTAQGVGRAVAVVTIVLFAGLLGGFKSGHDVRHVLTYLAAQTGLIVVLYFTLPDATGLLILLNILSVHAALMLPPRLVANWLALVAVLIGLGLVDRQGWPSLVLLLGPMSGNLAFAVMGGALRQAEAARQQSQSLWASVFLATADDVRRSADAGLIQLPATTHEPTRNFVLKRGLFQVRAEDIPRFVAGFNALIAELDGHRPAWANVDYGCTVAFYPRPGRTQPKRRGSARELPENSNPGDVDD